MTNIHLYSLLYYSSFFKISKYSLYLVLIMDESRNISARTWARTVDPINKVGYLDGVIDGQAATYQTSFNTGYDQGINFGFNLGIMDAKAQHMQKQKVTFNDPRQINCQICLNGTFLDENTGNLFNLQKVKNDEFLQISDTNPIS